MGSIYKITNTVNDKAYIGKTAYDAEKKRISRHLNGHGSLVLARAVKKYGKSVFVYEILHDGIIPELLDSYEIEAIKKYNTLQPNGYNLTIGGEGTVGYKLSAEQCRKMSEARKGKPSGRKGKKASPETRRKLSEAHKGYKHSEETRQKMSSVHKSKKYNLGSKWSSPEARKKRGEKWIGSKNPRFSPMHIPSKQFYFSLPVDMSIAEKRKQVKHFSGKDAKTVWRWIKQWQSEQP